MDQCPNCKSTKTAQFLTYSSCLKCGTNFNIIKVLQK